MSRSSVPNSPARKPPWGFWIRSAVALALAPWFRPKAKPPAPVEPSEGAADYSPDSTSDSDDYRDLAENINPVTGCYEPPRPSATENMTDEQKEVEAMRLVSLIDQLSRQGCIQPVCVGADGRIHAMEHVLELQQGIDASRWTRNGDDGSDEDQG